jgi:hypothetical protein
MMRVPLWAHYFRRGAHVSGCTLVVVPDGSDAPLTVRISGRAARALGGLVVAAGALVGVAVVSIGLDLTDHSRSPPPACDAKLAHYRPCARRL